MGDIKLTKANRIFYINDDGGLFVQFRANKKQELLALRACVEDRGETVYYTEELPSGICIRGYVLRVTKSGIALRDWLIK